MKNEKDHGSFDWGESGIRKEIRLTRMLHERKRSKRSIQIRYRIFFFLSTIASFWHHSKAQVHALFLCVSTLCIRAWCLELAEPELNAQQFCTFTPSHIACPHTSKYKGRGMELSNVPWYHAL